MNIKSFRKLIEKELGSETFEYKSDFDRDSTSSLKLDNFIGGGIVPGRIIEIFGDFSSGKTTLATLIAVSLQKKYINKAIGFIDVEHSYNHSYAKSYGLDYDDERFVFCQPNSGDEALLIAEKMLESGLFSLVIIDSVSAMMTKKQLSGDIGDQTIGELARLMSSSLPKLNNAATRTDTSLIFINQLRSAIGTFSPMGTPTTTSGGKALKYYCSLRLEIKKINFILDKTTSVGQEIKVYIRKNKCGNNYGSTDLNIYYNEGFRIEDEIVELAKEFNVIESKGAWVYFKDMKWNGVKVLTEAIKNDKELLSLIFLSYLDAKNKTLSLSESSVVIGEDNSE